MALLTELAEPSTMSKGIFGAAARDSKQRHDESES
jgi:hypothetical protein